MVLIAGIFALAFSCSLIDPQGAGQTLAGWLTGLGLPASGATARHVAFAVAAAFAAAGAAVRTWGTAYLDVDTMMDARLRANRLVIAGPYRHVRNPLYLGNLLVCVGTGLLASRLGFMVLMIGMTGFLYRLILREEQHLRRQHGDAFRRFLTVPRLWPAVRARVSADATVPPRWGRALGGEILMWANALATVIYAVSFSVAAFAITLSVGAIAAAVRFRAAH
jgi:protein-S-isoprenylcysteine O-methyltransferase Ste14